MNKPLHEMTNSELIEHEYDERSDDIASELADRLTQSLTMLGAMINAFEEITDNQFIKVPYDDAYYHINQIKKLLN